MDELENNQEVIENEEVVEDNQLEQEQVEEIDFRNESLEGETEDEAIDRIANKFDSFEELENSIVSLKSKLGIEDDTNFEDLSDIGKVKYYKNLESKIGKEEEIFVDESNDLNQSNSGYYEDQDFFKDSELDVEDKDLFNKYANEFVKQKELSEDSRTEIKAKYNLPDEIIDEYLSNLDFKVQSEIKTQETSKQYEIVNSIYKNVAPAQEMNDILNWGVSNLSEYQIKLFNQELASGDKSKALIAAKELKSIYSTANKPKPTRVIKGKSNSTPSSVGFSNQAEYQAEIAKPEYKTSEKFRTEVRNKLQKSKFFKK